MAGIGSRGIFGAGWECLGGQGIYTSDPQRYEQIRQPPGDWLYETGRRD